MNESQASPLDHGPIVVGLKGDPPRAIIDTAERLALAFGCELVFAYIEVNSALLELDAPALIAAQSFAPELDDEMSAIAKHIDDTLGIVLAQSTVRWTLRVLAGDPGTALERLANDVGARMLVVGTRRPGPIHLVEELLSGAVGKKLAMHQPRPVLLVPLGASES